MSALERARAETVAVARDYLGDSRSPEWGACGEVCNGGPNSMGTREAWPGIMTGADESSSAQISPDNDPIALVQNSRASTSPPVLTVIGTSVSEEIVLVSPHRLHDVIQATMR